MDLSGISQFKELGIGIAGLLVIGYILYFFIKSHKEELDASRQERMDAATALMSFVNLNNHQKTEMIEKHTEAMVNVGRSIELNTKTIERLVDKIN